VYLTPISSVEGLAFGVEAPALGDVVDELDCMLKRQYVAMLCKCIGVGLKHECAGHAKDMERHHIVDGG